MNRADRFSHPDKARTELSQDDLDASSRKLGYGCPACGDRFSNPDIASDHIREEHPEMDAEFRGGEIQVSQARESEVDLVEWARRITAKAGRRRNR